MGIVLELVEPTIYGAGAIFGTKEDSRETPGNFRRGLPQRCLFPRAGRKFDLELISIEVMEFLQRFQQKEINRKPDRSTPVGISSKQSRAGFRRLVVHAMFHSVDRKDVWVALVEFRDGSNSVLRKKFGFAE